MSDYIPAKMQMRLRKRFSYLYGNKTDTYINRLQALITRHAKKISLFPQNSRWDQTDNVLITYADAIWQPGQKTLPTLAAFLQKYLQQIIKNVHLLPFFPYSSDDGFSVIDYRRVKEEYGDWQDICSIGKDFCLMFDLVLNHVSSNSDWVQNYCRGIAPYKDYFIEMPQEADLSQVMRPRNLPLLTPFSTVNGERHLWTTFSADQVDINMANVDVLFEFIDILLLYVSMGARIIRLDAIAYLWKQVSTPCIHLPQTHEIVKLLRDVLEIAAPHVILLTETNVPHQENISYFGDGDEAHMVYQFSLPPLIVHALHNETAQYLKTWAADLPTIRPGCTFLNFTASHDGIGVRPLDGLVPQAQIATLVDNIKKRGGYVSTKKNADGSESPYELNISYFDAVAALQDSNMQIARFLCSQIIMLALQGIPAIYFPSLIGTRNYYEGVKSTGQYRTINRRKWQQRELQQLLSNPKSVTSKVFQAYCHLLSVRSQHPAFHPDGTQKVLDIHEQIFALQRTSPREDETIVCISNLSSRSIRIDGELPLSKVDGGWHDCISGNKWHIGNFLAPYQSCWLHC